jgi:hypothetical protein
VKRRPLQIVLLLAAIMLAVPSVAFALRSYDGDDYSEDWDSIRRVRICDNESDGNGAYTNYQTTGSGSTFRIEDQNGSSAGCTSSGLHVRIYRHQACEDVAAWPDHCGPYVYP